MYNTAFKVKYNDIEIELLAKFIDTSSKNEECEYSKDDILDVCQKLYQDELISVFYAESISDDKIDTGIKIIFDKLKENIFFNNVFNDLKQTVLNEELKNHEYKCLYNSDFLIFVSFFRQHIFYLTHIIICQYLTTGFISPTLLVELKEISIEFL